MKIFLIGYMGCGKSTLGRSVASQLGLDFVDMDSAITTREGRSINEIFASDGEAGFRKIEREVLESLLAQENVVVATGGGVPCFGDNIELINQHALSIYLDVDMGVLISRLKGAKAKRPLIASKTDEELSEFVRDALEFRRPYYEKAKLTISGISLKGSDVVAVVQNSLKK